MIPGILSLLSCRVPVWTVQTHGPIAQPPAPKLSPHYVWLTVSPGTYSKSKFIFFPRIRKTRDANLTLRQPRKKISLDMQRTADWSLCDIFRRLLHTVRPSTKMHNLASMQHNLDPNSHTCNLLVLKFLCGLYWIMAPPGGAIIQYRQKGEKKNCKENLICIQYVTHCWDEWSDRIV